MTPFAHTTAIHFALPFRPTLSALALAVSLALAACGGGGDEAAGSSTDASGSSLVDSTPTQTPTGAAAGDATAGSTPNAAPRNPNSAAWSTRFRTNYQVLTESDLGLFPQALNSRGDIAGTVSRGTLLYAATWRDGQVQDTRLLMDRADCGAGVSCTYPDIQYLDEDRNLFLSWSYKGLITAMAVWREGAATAQRRGDCVALFGVNDAGEALCREAASGLDRSGLWNLNTMDVTLLSGEETAMNRAGTRAGVSTFKDLNVGAPVHRLFRVKGGNVTVLDMQGYATAKVTRINAKDVVIGERGLPGDDGVSGVFEGRVRPFVWRPDAEPVDLPCPETFGRAWDINQDGSIVGECRVTDGEIVRSVAVLWKDGQVVDLAAHAAAGAPWRLPSATAINDQGWILSTAEGFGPVLLMPQ